MIFFHRALIFLQFCCSSIFLNTQSYFFTQREKKLPSCCLTVKPKQLKAVLMQVDQQLIALSRKGNMLAFRQLVEKHEVQVRSTVIGMLGDTPEAEDVTQEVFIRFYRSLEKFREEAALSTYLTRIAINLSLNELKRRKKKNLWLGSLKKGSPAFELEDQSVNPERSEMKDLLRKALNELDADFRAVVVLRLIDGYSVKETAEILNVPEGTVASRLARAQKKLKSILQQWM